MNLAFLILIAIPLGLYLLVLIASTRNFTPDGKPSPRPAESIAPATHEVVQDAAIASAIAAGTSTGEPADTEKNGAIAPANLAETSADEPGPDARETSIALAKAPTAEQSAEAAPTELAAAVALADIREPATETTNLLSAPVDQNTPTIEDPTVPATPEQAGQPTPTATPPAQEQDDPSQPILSGQSLILPADAPKYAFDYRGRLWVEKKRRGFFRQLRRPQLPPDDPTNPSNR